MDLQGKGNQNAQRNRKNQDQCKKPAKVMLAPLNKLGNISNK